MFAYGGESGSPRMYWKMSIDLKKPHVLSDGKLDQVNRKNDEGILASFETSFLTLREDSPVGHL